MKRIFSEEIFNPAFPLEGPHLVAASAGTGKTYNIQNIYARLIAEKGFRTSQIQVMTFTEKATKELRDRVRRVLADLSRLFAGDVAGFKPEELERLEKLRACACATIGGAAPDSVARTRVELALMEFDQASITTIHGFCRRALVRFAFETDSAFKAEFADTKEQDLARRVPCIVNDEHRILSIGYNGMPNGCNDDDMPWERSGETSLDTKYPFVCHAELNAILNSASRDLKGCTMYVTLFPCNECTKALIQSGIRRIVYYDNKYADTESTRASVIMLEKCGIKFEQYRETARKLELSV